MMIYPRLEYAKDLSQNYNVIPISMEIYADMETPIRIFKKYENKKYCFLLESVEGGEKLARYSFIGRDPFLIFKSEGRKISICKKNEPPKELMGNPIEVLRGIMENYRTPYMPHMPRFCGGAVGFFGYDLIRHYENLPDIPKDDLNLPECHFMFTDEVIVFDHLKQKIKIFVNMHVSGEVEESYLIAQERLREIHREILCPTINIEEDLKKDKKNVKDTTKYTSNVSMQEYCDNVIKAKEYIKDGDIFQVVLSQRLCVSTKSDPLNVYRLLRLMNPSPYLYFLKFDDYILVGSSPEMLTRVEDDFIETRPMAGTRKRGQTLEGDKRLERDLLSNEKEIAEHTMLVDLGRNDIGKVSEFGSILLKDFMHVEKYSHVMHIVTNVIGRLRKDKTAFDALMSIMPAGTLSGAPKVRAMEIIDELENIKRGPYGGAVGYLSFNGNLDTCITIRTIIFKGDKAYVQSGAGIVYDSDPEKEYEECLNKAKVLLKALEEAGDVE